MQLDLKTAVALVVAAATAAESLGIAEPELCTTQPSNCAICCNAPTAVFDFPNRCTR